MSALRVELFWDEEAGNWHYRVPALHINGGGTATREEAERESLAAIGFALEGIHEITTLERKPSPSTSASHQPPEAALWPPCTARSRSSTCMTTTPPQSHVGAHASSAGKVHVLPRR